MPHLECVNEEFKHYFIVDTPPSSFRDRKGNPKPKGKSGRSISLLIKRSKSFLRYTYR